MHFIRTTCNTQQEGLQKKKNFHLDPVIKAALPAECRKKKKVMKAFACRARTNLGRIITASEHSSVYLSNESCIIFNSRIHFSRTLSTSANMLCFFSLWNSVRGLVCMLQSLMGLHKDSISQLLTFSHIIYDYDECSTFRRL